MLLLFENRTVQEIPSEAQQSSHSGIGLKVALGSYRMFFVQNTCDYYIHRPTIEDVTRVEERMKDVRKEAKDRMDRWIGEKMGDAVVQEVTKDDQQEKRKELEPAEPVAEVADVEIPQAAVEAEKATTEVAAEPEETATETVPLPPTDAVVAVTEDVTME